MKVSSIALAFSIFLCVFNVTGQYLTRKKLHDTFETEMAVDSPSKDPRTHQTPSKRGRSLVNTNGEITVEVALVVSKSCYEQYNRDERRIIDYYRMLLYGVNELYAQFKKPTVKVVYTGFVFLKTPEEQPFIEKYIHAPAGYAQMPQFVQEFKAWAERNQRKLPKYDIATLMTCEMVPSNYQGYAEIAGVCNPWGIVWVKDFIGTYTGVNIFAHELAHALGSWHDGDYEQRFCAAYNGYLMSPIAGVGSNRKIWSSCTMKAIETTASTREGACLWRKDSPSNWIPEIESKYLPKWKASRSTPLDGECQVLLNHGQFGNQLPYMMPKCRYPTTGLP